MASSALASPLRPLLASVAAAVLGVGLLAGCTPSDGTAAGPTSSAAAEVATEVALPDSPLGEQARWILASLNEAPDASALSTEIGERFTPEFLDQVSADELATIFGQLAAEAPYTPTAVQDAGETAVITITAASGESLDVQLAVDADGLVAGLLFAPSAADRTPATSWSELETAVEGFAADTTLVVTEVTGGAAGDRVAEAGSASASASSPSGSMFKLYVLGAVADAVAAGTLTWDTPLTLTDDVKSLPSGELQDVPSGTTITVQDAAQKMIEISDNTATDLLIAAVGAPAVAEQLTVMGHHDPAENTPFLTTRALFQLGWGDGGDGGAAREAWRAAEEQDGAEGVAARQAVIDALPTGLLDIPVTAVTTPAWQDGLDWFTTPDDLVAAHLALQQKAATPAGAPIRDILSTNPGLGEFGDDWSYVAFKGGSSIGVLAGSWYLERADGRMFVVTIQGSSDDPAALTDQATFFGQVQDAVALLEKE